MPYIMETCICGKVREVTKRFSSRYGIKGLPRGNNTAPTSLQMQKINERNAETKVRRLLNANFRLNDMHLVLTYLKGVRPTPDQAKKDIEKFIRKLRALYKKRGLALKYIQVTEYKKAAIHHHLVINFSDFSDMVAIQNIWPHGKARPTLLDGTGQYARLAHYLIKETKETFNQDYIFGKRYNSSKNLIIPKPKKEIVLAQTWREEPKAIKDYVLEKDSVINGVCEYNGFPYQFYSMVRIDNIRLGAREG